MINYPKDVPQPLARGSQEMLLWRWLLHLD